MSAPAPTRPVTIGLGVGRMDPDARAGDLRRMKAVATGLLIAATIVFAFARYAEHRDGSVWVGYIRAAAEAGMVGALADWFAVTALFRRPLGLPIPHTAIIPTKKDALGDGLGDFVGENFLSEDVVRARLTSASIASRLGVWIAEPSNAERVTNELANAIGGAVTVLRDDDVQALIEQTVVRRLTARPIGPPAGVVLHGIVADRAHHRVVDLVVERAHRWIVDNRAMIVDIVRERAPGWSPRFVDSMVADRVFGELERFALAVRGDPDHPVRQAVDRYLLALSDDLQHDPATIDRAERVKQQILDQPDVQSFIGQAWGTIKSLLLDAAEDPSSELRTRVRDALVATGHRLEADEQMRSKIDGWIGDAAAYVVRHYRDEITTLITDTVARWDPQETSRKIELQVGRDLQFIRINGTVVGALAGLAIHTASELLLS